MTHTSSFQLVSPFSPTGDQPQAIESLVAGLRAERRDQVLLGVTGSGKTFTIANVVERVNLPTLVISHNKTLAAQLYQEFKDFFPNNAVEYFVSYYDYYQPEAYIASTDTYIEKDASINEELDKLRLSATSSLMQRRDVLIVASVSCIYGLGSPEEYRESMLDLSLGQTITRKDLLQSLVDLFYERTPWDLQRGQFRVRGDTVDVFPGYEDSPLRIELWGDEVDKLCGFDSVTGKKTVTLDRMVLLPTKHFITSESRRKRACQNIQAELEETLVHLRSTGKLLEAQRLEMRTRYDLEMLEEIGHCAGIENYSRHFAGRKPGDPPDCLLDYFPRPFLVVVDESHVTLPQIRGMVNADRSRKRNLVEHGFRLPSAMDNRPQTFEEFNHKVDRIIYVSATPAAYELEQAGEAVVEQLIRPTGLVDPKVQVRPAEGQVDDLLERIRDRVSKKQRVLVTTLTKRMAEDLTEYLNQLGVRVRYLHSDVDAIERVEILRDLRKATFDVLVGINLLREGLDLPEVTLVAILDADQEGFLRSETSIIQTAGRAARNLEGEVVLYADRITGSMERALAETSRRRQMQIEYNELHGITPRTVEKGIRDLIEIQKRAAHTVAHAAIPQEDLEETAREKVLYQLEKEMLDAAEELAFERAMVLRDRLQELKEAWGVDGLPYSPGRSQV